MLVSPAEPAELRRLGEVSSMPERYGADFLLFSPHLGRIGIQRKEIKDLLASLSDDRLAKEIQQLQCLNIGIVLLEGHFEWTTDGYALGMYTKFTKAQYQGILWSLQLHGLWTSCTSSMTDTIEYLSLFTRWATKDRHTTLVRRTSQPRNVYGTKGSRDWQIHVLQGFPGLGYERATNIVDYFGGLPLAWTGSLKDVPGIGDRLSGRLEHILDPDTEKSPQTPGTSNGGDGGK